MTISSFAEKLKQKAEDEVKPLYNMSLDELAVIYNQSVDLFDKVCNTLTQNEMKRLMKYMIRLPFRSHEVKMTNNDGSTAAHLAAQCDEIGFYLNMKHAINKEVAREQELKNDNKKEI